jgi:hypothetical protein
VAGGCPVMAYKWDMKDEINVEMHKDIETMLGS